MKHCTNKNMLQNKNVIIVGAGVSGIAAARLASAKGANVRILEKDPDAVDADKARILEQNKIDITFGEHSREQFEHGNMIVPSPGIPPGQIRNLLPENCNIPIYSELEFAYWFIDAPVVGVTGTNGKTTTVRLIENILRYAGYTVFLGGNIGVPLSDYAMSEDRVDIIVLEVSSFQLELIRDFRPHVGVLLNISPNHLDYHADMQEYFLSKMRLFENQKSNDLAIFPAEMQETVQSENWTQAEKRFFDSTYIWNCPALIGAHNQANIQAATLVCEAWGVNEQVVENALSDFQSYPHRLQQVCEKGGVLFVDDSKATTLDALKAALNSMDRPVLLLAGGIFKGGDPTELCGIIREKVRMIGLFGDSREIFEQAWKDCAPMFWENTLQDALKGLYATAARGDVVLLSPATSSFDLFSSYKERGRAFQKAVFDLDNRLNL